MQLSLSVRRPSPHAEPVLVCAILRVLQPYSVLFVYPCSWARRDPQDLCRCRAHFPYPYSRARRAGLGIPCRIPSTRHSPVRGCLYLSVSPAANKALQRTPVNVAKKSSCVHACFAWWGSSLHHGAPLSLSVRQLALTFMSPRSPRTCYTIVMSMGRLRLSTPTYLAYGKATDEHFAS